jgi:PAS domain S-box-containing protein
LIGQSKPSRDGGLQQAPGAAAANAGAPTGVGVTVIGDGASPRDQLYRDVVEDQSEFICRYRPDGTLTFVNAAYCRQFGRDAHELIGRSILPLLPEPDRVRMENRITSLTRDEPVITTKRREIHGDGAIRWYRWTDRGIFDATGGLVEVQSVGQDVSEAERQTQMLEGQSEILEMIAQDVKIDATLERLALVVERIAAPTMCSILLLSADGSRLHHAAAPSLPEAYSSAIDGVSIGPNVGSCGTAAFRRQPVVVSDIDIDPLWADYRELAGAYGLRACWSYPVIGQSGEVLGTFALYSRTPREPEPQDWHLIESMARLARIAIEQDRRRRALGEATQRLSSVAANVPGVVYQRRVGADGSIAYTYISDGARDLFGIAPEEIIADPHVLMECFGAAFRAQFMAQAAEASRLMTLWDIEVPIVTRGGQHKWTHSLARPRRMPDGSVLWDGVILDVTRSKRAELGAAMAQTRLRDAVESISEGFILFDREDRVVIFNSRYSEFYPGLAQIAKPGMTFEEILETAQKNGTLRDESAIANPEGWVQARLAAHRNPGKTLQRRLSTGRWILVNERRTADGGIVSVHTDITGLKEREEEVRRQSTLLQTTLDNMDQGLSAFDKDLNLIAANSRFLDLVNFPRDWGKIGTPFAAFMRVNAERGEYGPGDIEQQVAERVELAKRFEPHLFERTRPDGSIIEVRGRPIIGGGFVTTYTDITARKQSEEALREASATLQEKNRQFDVALAHMSQGLTLYDDENRLVAFNPRYVELYGLPLDRVRPGMGLREVMQLSVEIGNYTAVEAEQIVESRLRVAASRQRTVFHQKLVSGRIVEIIHLPLPQGGAVATFTDVTEREETQRALMASEDRLRERVLELEETRKRLEHQGGELATLAESLRKARDEAEAASRTKSEFLANMSHELRTPLNAIIGFSEIMMGELFGKMGDDRYRDYAKDVHNSGRHLLELINDILDLSKVEAGKLDLHEDDVDVGHVLANCERLVRERAQEAGVVLCVEAGGTLPRLAADETKLKQILLNLLSNAVKFTPAGGRVTLAAALNDAGELALSVRDTGIGMKEEDIPIALQPFRQIDNQLSRKYAGTGLGLPLTRALVEMHDGRLEITSAPGKGTTVIVVLPASRLRAPAGASARA